MSHCNGAEINESKMKLVITASNFSNFKVQILNACSIFGNVNHPDTWATSLNLFDFDEAGEDLASSLLIETYYSQLKAL